MADLAIVRAKIMLDVDTEGAVLTETANNVYNMLNASEKESLTSEQKFTYIASEISNVIRTLGDKDLDTLVTSIIDNSVRLSGVELDETKKSYYHKLCKVIILSKENVFGTLYAELVNDIIQYSRTEDVELSVAQDYMVHIKYLNILLGEQNVDMSELRLVTTQSEVLAEQYALIPRESLKYDFHI